MGGTTLSFDLGDLDGIPMPTDPIVPYIECVHDRIAVEIMRGCPWQCRFCQSTVIKRPLRIRSVETIVNAIRRGGLFSVVVDILPTPIADAAHVVLPAATAGEMNLTSMNGERRMRLSEKFMEPPGEAKADCLIAAEIANAMLRRQQASAIIAARSKIVAGAVSMVEMALEQLRDKHVVELDEEYERVAVHAAQIMGLRFAGVDMLEGNDGPLVMEVNSSPGLEGIEQATELDVAGASVRVIMGEAYGHVSPVMSYTPMVYLEYGIPRFPAVRLSPIATMTPR